MAQVMARISADSHRKLKIAAAKNNTTIQDIITDAVIAYLEAEGEDGNALRREIDAFRAQEKSIPHAGGGEMAG